MKKKEKKEKKRKKEKEKKKKQKKLKRMKKRKIGLKGTVQCGRALVCCVLVARAFDNLELWSCQCSADCCEMSAKKKIGPSRRGVPLLRPLFRVFIPFLNSIFSFFFLSLLLFSFSLFLLLSFSFWFFFFFSPIFSFFFFF